jgi:hypothetical protein
VYGAVVEERDHAAGGEEPGDKPWASTYPE